MEVNEPLKVIRNDSYRLMTNKPSACAKGSAGEMSDTALLDALLTEQCAAGSQTVQCHQNGERKTGCLHQLHCIR